MKKKHKQKQGKQGNHSFRHGAMPKAGMALRQTGPLQILTGSLLAASLLPGIAAAVPCTTAGTGTIVNSSTGCYEWTGGDFSVMATGTISGASFAIQANNTLSGRELSNFGTIVGVDLGIQNLGKIDSLKNNGAVVGTGSAWTTMGVQNTSTGSIRSMINSANGYITGTGVGVSNAGTIVRLNNLGFIAGTSSAGSGIAGVDNNGGTISTLANSGTILGSQTNVSNVGFAVVSQNGGGIGSVDNSGLVNGMFGVLALNTSTVGSLTNTGTISGSLSGVAAVAGTIQAIDNSGLISGGAGGTIIGNPSGPYAGILAQVGGSVGSVTNSGTITGLYNAIEVDNISTIGPIANSGLIAGDITSASTQDLTIAGGSGTAIGTLTGLSGGLAETDKGFIKLTGANLVFTSGNLLLNDDIGVNAGYAVINNGATLQINNPITVHGDYTQTGGGLAINAANATTYGYLDVSGSASVSNSAISLSGSSLAAGQTYSVVRAAGSAAYSGNTAFVSVNNGLLAQLSTVGGNLVATLAPDAQHHYWDGANTAADGTIAGGSGTWTATGTNWTSTDGTSNGKLDTADVRPVFGGTAGTVTVDNSLGAIKVSGMQFSTDGYRVTGSPINLTAAASAIEVDDNVNATIDSVLQGNGGLAKTGNGLLILNGANTYSGGTTVDAGTLEIGDADHAGASILGDVAVGSAGTLRGHGTIGGSVTNNGVVRPGGSIGTLTIAGNYTQSPSGTLFVDVSPTAASQLKVGGTATLGGTLNVLYGPGTYSAASYRIIDASSVSGQFSSVTSNAPAELAQSVQRLADGSTLTLSPAGTDNGGTDNGGGTGGGTVVVKPTNATIFGAMGSAAIREGQRVNETLLSRLGQACADAASAADCARPGRQAWAQIVSDTAHVRGNDDAPSYKDSHYGFLTGLDHQVGDWTLGIAGGYSHTDVSEDDASGKIDTVRVAGYGSRRLGPVDVAATVGAAYDFLQSRRSFAGLGSAKGDTDGQEITAGLQASLPLATGRFTITPRVGLRYQYFHADSFGENGSTSQNLHVGSQDINSLQPYAQLAVGLPFTTGAARPALVEARVGYAYETLDASRTVAAAASDGTRFTLPGVAPSRGMLTAGVGLTLPLGKAVDITASYDRLFDTGNVSAQAFQLQGRYRF
ncbi:autotransporter outer membrane beta-barrel domain-containing protein [Bordetella genomosp. 11]|uniref:Autotransporter domain-containing protein n=1 Tax=Bordetella genomosp. 11 TaxID=1416808 RepID=A0A261UM43_9BORD|nr:autotransporter domain-containing protein [Bordetella genomosp. 11]OZI62452.1 hypothetical protein CAL28_25080 [Bordetella genomosp. 11]